MVITTKDREENAKLNRQALLQIALPTATGYFVFMLGNLALTRILEDKIDAKSRNHHIENTETIPKSAKSKFAYSEVENLIDQAKLIQTDTISLITDGTTKNVAVSKDFKEELTQLLENELARAEKIVLESKLTIEKSPATNIQGSSAERATPSTSKHREP